MLGTPMKRRWHILILMMLTLAMVLPGLASLPVIDRDEARFAQASVQMAETNDLLNIKFQDEARNKKPAMAYWAQTSMIKIFVKGAENKIWAQRLPSVLAALLTILALYWGSLHMVGRDVGLIACALLATSLIFVFEGHIAKTDALLCASTTVIFASLGRLRSSEGRLEVWAFWTALGFSIIIKGPIGPALAALTLGSLWISERNLSWARPLLNWKAASLFVLIWVPWAVAIFAATDGAFFIDSLGQDFGGKVVSGQESHGAPPGIHSLTIWMTLWPASLFLLPALVFVIRSIRAKTEDKLTRTLRFALCWAAPFWILIELMPTKLPHYGLPIFPALCLMMGTGILAMIQKTGFTKTRIVSGVIFLISTMGLLAILIFVQSRHGGNTPALPTFLICAAAGIAAILASVALWENKIRFSVGAALMTGMILTIGTYSHILPNLTDFGLSERTAAELNHFAPALESRNVHSPHYTEPSLVYHLGKEIDVKGGGIELSSGNAVILDLLRFETADLISQLTQSAKDRGMCVKNSKRIEGFNYSNGEQMSLVILREVPC